MLPEEKEPGLGLSEMNTGLWDKIKEYGPTVLAGGIAAASPALLPGLIGGGLMGLKFRNSIDESQSQQDLRGAQVKDYERQGVKMESDAARQSQVDQNAALARFLGSVQTGGAPYEMERGRLLDPKDTAYDPIRSMGVTGGRMSPEGMMEFLGEGDNVLHSMKAEDVAAALKRYGGEDLQKFGEGDVGVNPQGNVMAEGTKSLSPLETMVTPQGPGKAPTTQQGIKGEIYIPVNDGALTFNTMSGELTENYPGALKSLQDQTGMKSAELTQLLGRIQTRLVGVFDKYDPDAAKWISEANGLALALIQQGIPLQQAEDQAVQYAREAMQATGYGGMEHFLGSQGEVKPQGALDKFRGGRNPPGLQAPPPQGNAPIGIPPAQGDADALNLLKRYAPSLGFGQ